MHDSGGRIHPTPYNSWLTCAAVRTGHKYTHCKGTENTTLKTRRRLCFSNTWKLSLYSLPLDSTEFSVAEQILDEQSFLQKMKQTFASDA